MRIGYDAKRCFHNRSGLGNYGRTLVKCVGAHCPDVEAKLYDERLFTRTFRLGRHAKADGCALFHGLSNELPFDIVRAGLPSVVTLHDVAWRTFPSMYSSADRLAYDLKYGWACRHATRVLVISESTKRDAMRYLGVPEDRIVVLYQAVQDLFYRLVDAEAARTRLAEALPRLPREFVLSVGSINARKNLLTVVKALAAMRSDDRPPLVVVGNGDAYRREVERYIDAHGLRGGVTILDDLRDNGLLQCLYRTAKAFVYPSFYEGFGLPVVEAALQSRPVITSNISSLPEAAGDGAMLVDPHDVEQLRDALARILSDAAFAEALGAKAERYARATFDPATLTRKLGELYRSLV